MGNKEELIEIECALCGDVFLQSEEDAIFYDTRGNEVCSRCYIHDEECY